MRKRRKLAWAAAAVTAGLLLVGRPAVHLSRSAIADRHDARPTPPRHADDASRLNRTPVREVFRVPADPALAERQLAALLERARREKLRVSIAGARHTMGGHTLYPGGIVVDMLPFRGLALSADGTVLTAGAGAMWRDVIPFLDRHGRSVAVMQSDNSFSVGGTVSANAHGWQVGHPPIAATVRAFRLMTADGRVVRCSRAENAELFSLVLGGYGLFGIILEVELETVPNQRYRAERFAFPADSLAARFRRHVREQGDVEMAYARFSVHSGAFLREAVLTTYHRAPAPDGAVPALGSPALTGIKRTVFRGSVGSDYGKELRWTLERRLGEKIGSGVFSRNQLLNDAVDVYADRSEATTDVLHEYFVPPEAVPAFLRHAREIVPRHGGDLLNLTVRDVRADTTTFLRYARRDVLALVMFFSQPRTADGEARMAAMTRELIDAALSLGGTYYLPYRPHATREQFRRAYPQADEFFARKRRYDPDERFQSSFYRNYGPRE